MHGWGDLYIISELYTPSEGRYRREGRAIILVRMPIVLPRSLFSVKKFGSRGTPGGKKTTFVPLVRIL